MFCNNCLPHQPLSILLETDGTPVLLPAKRSIFVGADDAAIAAFLHLNPTLVQVQLAGGLAFSPNAPYETVEVA